MMFSFKNFAVVLVVYTTSVLATPDVYYCSYDHGILGSNGNSFSISVSSVPEVSQSSICGSFERDLKSQTSANGVNIDIALDCSTDNGLAELYARVTLNKQSPSMQGNLLIAALRQAFGTQGLYSPTGGCPSV
jgi:hypothetical protein